MRNELAIHEKSEEYGTVASRVGFITRQAFLQVYYNWPIANAVSLMAFHLLPFAVLESKCRLLFSVPPRTAPSEPLVL